MNMQVNVRAVVLDILLEIYEKGQYTHLVLNEAVSSGNGTLFYQPNRIRND